MGGDRAPFPREEINGAGRCPTYLYRWTLLRLGKWFVLGTLPDAAECYEIGDIMGYRYVRDPIGGQKYRVWLNPNDLAVGTMQARSARLV